MRVYYTNIMSPCWGGAGDRGCAPTSRGNHLSNATCLTQAFFKRGEECSTL